MFTLAEVDVALRRLAPLSLAADWDNVGLLVGDPAAPVRRAMTCLTITPASAAEAIAERADLIVTHHPLPFQPLRRITTETAAGRLLLDLIAQRIAIYSAHTAFDSAADGINQSLAEGLGLTEIRPLVPRPDAQGTSEGSGRHGRLPAPTSLDQLAARLTTFLNISGLHVGGAAERSVAHVAIACGSGGDFLEAARAAGCDVLVTGEARFHACLEAESTGVALLLPGHFASERFAQQLLAERLTAALPGLAVWCSRREADPLRWR